MRCKAKTTNGQPCQAQAITGSKFCFTHDPASGAARAKARKAGGQRNRTPHVLDYSLAETLPLENSIQRGRLLVAICGAFIEAIKTGELESRLAAIESALKAREVKQ